MVKVVTYSDDDWVEIPTVRLESVGIPFLDASGRVKARFEFRGMGGDNRWITKNINIPFDTLGLEKNGQVRGEKVGHSKFQRFVQPVLLPHPGQKDAPAHDIASLAIHANALFEYQGEQIILVNFMRNAILRGALEIQGGTGFVRIKRPDDHANFTYIYDNGDKWIYCKRGLNILGKDDCTARYLNHHRCPDDCELFDCESGMAFYWWVPVAQWVRIDMEIEKGKEVVILQRGRKQGTRLDNTNAHYAAWVYDQMEEYGAPQILLDAVELTGKGMITSKRAFEGSSSETLQGWIDDVSGEMRMGLGYTTGDLFYEENNDDGEWD